MYTIQSFTTILSTKHELFSPTDWSFPVNFVILNTNPVAKLTYQNFEKIEVAKKSDFGHICYAIITKIILFSEL